MPIQNVLSFNQDLNKKVYLRDGGSISNADNNGVTVNVNLFYGEQAATISGTVVGAVVCPDGFTVPLIGTFSGNTVSVKITSDCVAVPGVIGLGVQIVNGTTKTTVFRVAFRVDVCETSQVVDPGSRTTIQIAELVTRIDNAINSIPSDYSNLLASLAPTFSTSTAYSVGQYVWYSGTLYRFASAHTAGAWNASQVTVAVICNDLSALQMATVAETKNYLGIA